MTKKRTRKQLQIAGTERPEHPEVVEAAEHYVAIRDERMQMTKKEAQAQADLLATLRAHKMKSYRFFDDNGTELEAYIAEPDASAKVRKTGEREPDADVAPLAAENGGIIGEAKRRQANGQAEADA